jgi:hypothetical protein
MGIPEWSIFDRLDELEKITLEQMEKTDTIEPTLKNMAIVARDAIILARHALWFGFVHSVAFGRNPRELKDSQLELLKKAGLSGEQLQWLEQAMILVCKLFERK